jgi:hypothetical protein
MNPNNKNDLINNIIKETKINKDGMENYIMSLYDTNRVYPKQLMYQYKDVINVIDIYFDRLIKFIEAKQYNDNPRTLSEIEKEINALESEISELQMKPSAPDIQYMNYPINNLHLPTPNYNIIPPPKYDNMIPITPPPKYERTTLYNLENDIKYNRKNNLLCVKETTTKSNKTSSCNIL